MDIPANKKFGDWNNPRMYEFASEWVGAIFKYRVYDSDVGPDDLVDQNVYVIERDSVPTAKPTQIDIVSQRAPDLPPTTSVYH